MTITWSKHSRRIEPISRSTYGICQGDRAAVSTSVICMFGCQCPEGLTIDSITVPKHVARRRVPRECLHQLLRRPLRSRMFGHVEMHHSSAFMSQNEEHIQDSETHRRHHEEVHRYQLLHVVLQERPPRLRWRLAVLHHVLRNRCLGYLDSELQQFPVQPRRSPEHVDGAHVADQVSDFLRHPRSSDPSPTALPVPVEPESFSMPADDRLGLDHHEGLAPVRPEANKGYPQEPVPYPKRTRLRLLRWRTASWCRSARISNWSEARVRSVEVNPASSDISTAHMVCDRISPRSQEQQFQLLRGFW